MFTFSLQLKDIRDIALVFSSLFDFTIFEKNLTFSEILKMLKLFSLVLTLHSSKIVFRLLS